jgi:hypothetical protein
MQERQGTEHAPDERRRPRGEDRAYRSSAAEVGKNFRYDIKHEAGYDATRQRLGHAAKSKKS